MATKKEKSYTLPILVALANLGLFGLMFGAMQYFELMGADTSYFDEGSIANIKNINMILSPLGLSIDPTLNAEISTRAYSICYGIALISTSLAIIVANRKSRDENEVTDAI